MPLTFTDGKSKTPKVIFLYPRKYYQKNLQISLDNDAKALKYSTEATAEDFSPYLSTNQQILSKNGYNVIEMQLEEFLELDASYDGTDLDFQDLTTVLKEHRWDFLRQKFGIKG